MKKVRDGFRWIVRIVVGIILLSIGIVLGGGLIECPEIVFQLVLVAAVAIWMITHFFKLLMPKSFTPAISRARKRAWKRFWKYVF